MNARLLLAPLAAATAIALAGCFPDKSFDCQGDDARCNTGERCIDHRCASPDSNCAMPTPFRFTSSAGALAGQCANPGMTPTGCQKDGDSCDPGDPCIINGRCAGGVCKGEPKTCPAQSCVAGTQLVQACVKGQCAATTTRCDPYLCDAMQVGCSTACKTALDCQPGFYCIAAKCTSCGDALGNLEFVPHFGAGAPIPGVNTMGGTEDSPYLAPDGVSLFFASDRPGGQGALDVWQATRTTQDPAKPFTVFKNLGGPPNTAADELDPFTLDGTTLIFSSDHLPNTPGDRDLFTSVFSMGQWSISDDLMGGNIAFRLNSSVSSEEHAVLSGDGKRLYFHTDRGGSPFGGQYPHIYTGTRANTVDPFGQLDPLMNLPSGPAWQSPSVGKLHNGLYLVNVGVSTRPEAAFVHLDGSGQPTGSVTLLDGINLAGGQRVSVTADGCGLLYTSRVADSGDLYWAFRDGVRTCTGVACGATDGCCPNGCTGLADPDCAYPHTITVLEYSSPVDGHLYLLSGEATPKDSQMAFFTPTKRVFRTYDAPPGPGAVAVHRYVSMKCGGTPYHKISTTSVGVDFVADDPMRTANPNDRNLGYVMPSAMVPRGGNPLSSATREGGMSCDQQVSFDACPGGYTCDPAFGVGVKP